MHRLFASLLAAVALMLAGCQSTPTERAIAIARAGGLSPISLPGAIHDLMAFERLRDGDDRIWVFLDSDGSPWTRGGTEVSADPTPREPLALRLAAATRSSVLYVSRPCYFTAPGVGERCDSKWWTSHRYAADVVDDIAVAIRSYLKSNTRFSRVTLVGYSGGGTLAALAADRIPEVSELVTVAGNLDIQAWTRLHGYLPLEGSLNPATAVRTKADLRAIHLVGLADENVPPRVGTAYFAAHPEDLVREYPGFGHVCCWVRDWSRIHEAIVQELGKDVQR
jgi:dienelactone hydrolase